MYNLRYISLQQPPTNIFMIIPMTQ